MTEGSLSRALRWPLWSWRNLAVTVGGFLVVGMALGRLTGAPVESVSAAHEVRPGSLGRGAPVGGPSPTAAGPAPSPEGPLTPAGPATSGPEVDEGRADAAARTAAAARASSFVTAWLRPGTATQRTGWLAPVASDRMVAQLAGLPASALALRPLAAPTVVAVDQVEATVTVPMSDGRTAQIGMTAEVDGWQVTSLSSTSAAAAAGSPPSGAVAR